MRALLAKEWRENRKLLWAFVVLAPLLSLGLKELIPDWRIRPDLSFAFVLPAFFALYVMAIGADLVAGDAGSGRLKFLATLPVRPVKIWAAKVIFLFVSAALFLGYALAVESVIFSASGGDLWGGFTDAVAREMQLGVAIGFALAAAVVLWSTLIDHGLAAVLGAILTLGGIALGVWFLALSKFEFRYATTIDVARLLAVPVGAFLIASALAFAKGRIHLGSRLRRVALAAATVAILLGAPGAWAAHRLVRWGEIRPGDTDVRVFADRRGVSPDGRWGFVYAQRRGPGPFGASRMGDGPYAAFAVNLTDGRLRDLTALGGGGWHDLFPEPGVLRLYRQEPTDDGKLTLEILYDLEEGEVTSTRPLPKDWRSPWTWKLGPWRIRWEKDGATILREGREPLRLPKGSHVFCGHGPIGVVARSAEGDFGLHLVESERRIDLPDGQWSGFLVPGNPSGAVLGVRRIGKDRTEIVRLPIAGGPPEVIREVEGYAWPLTTSPDGRRSVLLSRDTQEVILLDADRGAVRLPPDAPRYAPVRLTWSTDSDRFLLRIGGEWWAGDVSGDDPVVERRAFPPEIWDVVWYDGRRLLARSGGEARLLLVEPGAEPRQLLPLR